MQLYQDPFVYFITACFLVPPIWGAMGFQEVVTFTLQWSMVLIAIAVFFTVKVTKSTKQKRWDENGNEEHLSSEDQWTARWYLLNGWIIHVFLDGMVGAFAAHPVYADHYNQLDKRYGAALGSAEGTLVHTISCMEIIIYGPLCAYLYHAIHHKKSSRDVVEIITCTCQLFGAFMYVLPEVWQGMPNFSVDSKLEFTPLLIKDFWFGFVIGNSIYFTVPLILLVKACNRAHAAAIAAASTPTLVAASPVDTSSIVELARASTTSSTTTAAANKKKSPAKSQKKVDEELEEETPKKVTRSSTTTSRASASKRVSSSRRK